MTSFETYLDAIAFLAANTGVLVRLGWTFVAGIFMGALLLDRFKAWLWILMLFSFIALTQWQIDMVSHELGFTREQIMPPHLITILSALIFSSGSGLGYWIKTRKMPDYAKESPEIVADKIVKKVNGGAIDSSNAETVNAIHNH